MWNGHRVILAFREAYVRGVSTRRVYDVVEALGINSVSKSQVSRIRAALYPDHTFRPGATERVLTATERRLGHRLPRDLRGLLSESDGIHGEFDLGLVWPTERIVEDNLRMRTDTVPGDAFMPFDPLLFFGDAGNEDCFAFPLVSAPRDQNVFAWDHEDDSRS